MQMNAPAPRNALDENRQGLMGKAVDRVDGRLKVMGKAPYAHELVEGGAAAAYGYIVQATISKGMVSSINTSAAEHAPGVLMVMTHLNVPKQAAWGPIELPDRYARSIPQLGSRQIDYYGQPVAFVVANTFEQARSASKLITIAYAQVAGEHDMQSRKAKSELQTSFFGEPLIDGSKDDFDKAFAASAVTVDGRFSTPAHAAAPMEPPATLAYWEGNKLTVHCSAQLINSAQQGVASTLGIPLGNVRVVSRYIGGGFGSKLPIYGDVILSALAARELRRPVKTALTRQQMFHITSHRSDTVQRLRLGASLDGKLAAVGHEAWANSARYDNFFEPSALQTRLLYAAPARYTPHYLAKLDLPVSDSTRAPGEAVGMLALEVAMDELAEKLRLDPIELRLRNEPVQDQDKKVPFSSRNLVACMKDGAMRFGWSGRSALPAQKREGRWLVGMGMAASIRSNVMMPSKCDVALNREGLLTVKMAMTDIGTGSYTVFSQIAAEMMGLPMDRVRMELGDSNFPATPGSGGSWGAASAGSGLFDACTNLREKLATKMGIKVLEATFANSSLSGAGKTETLGALAGTLGMEASGEIAPGAMAKQFSQQAYGAHFAEVRVNIDTGEIRVSRLLGVFAAGRILNEKTAKSQISGAMIWGMGSALHEDAVIDKRDGHFVNHDLAEYHVPSHADVPKIEVYFLSEVDDKTNPLKIKGVGELGICGAGAAVANAVYNATGVRVREFPITLDKVRAGLDANRVV
ncbi:MAG: xanthine dehydrogenase family protein molybdopterin-binding subunit [Polaromonas sp.]|nr:xanthine dehydrogenase family protein molybdopterin-binding subunit [Polaromonas sp.]